MKRIAAFVLALVMLTALFGCGAGTKAPAANDAGETEEGTADDLTPLDVAQVIYQVLNRLAEGADWLGSDICQAWHTAIWNADDVVSGGAAYLAEQLTLSEDELREGLAHMAVAESGTDWDSVTDDQWEELRQKDSLFAEAQKKDGLFDFCINVIWSAYVEMGIYDTMDEGLSQVKELIRTLKEKDPENMYVEPLKEYYSVIRSYAEWCKAPDGSYNDAEALLNTYTDSYRSCRDDLEFDLGE